MEANNVLFEKVKKEVSKEMDSSVNMISLRADIYKQGEKLKATFRTDTSMFYGAGIQILGDMEKKYMKILNNNGLKNTVKNLGLDGKAEVDKAKNAFETKAKEFRKTIDAAWGFGLFSDNDKMVTTIAQSIINIKTTFMDQLLKEYNKEIIDEEKKVKKTITESQEKKGAIVNDTFTKVANPLPIQKVVSMSKFGNVDRLVLDYSGCTNQKIKDKAISCSADEKSTQIVIERKTINGIDTFFYEGTQQRALVWEGIRMLPAVAQAASKKGEEYQKKQTLAAEQTKKQQMGVYENYKALGIHLRTGLHTNGTEITEKQEKDISTKLYGFIESELTRLIGGALNGTSVPENPDAPFAGAITSGKLLVFEAMSGQADQYILRESELESMFGEGLGDEIYDLLDESANEATLKSFLNTRWKMLYQERVTKNKSFVIDAKITEKNGKTYTTNDEGKLEEVVLDDSQVYVEGLDVDWKTPQNAVWVQNKINAEMDKMIQEIKNGTITMPENAEPFGTNRFFGTKDEDENRGHYIEFDQENGIMDRNLFDFSLFAGKKDIQKIFVINDNNYKIAQYMNKVWKEKYTNIIKEKNQIKELSTIEDPEVLNTQIGIYLEDIVNMYKNNNEVDEQQKAELRIKTKEVSLGIQQLSNLAETMPEGGDRTLLMQNIQIYSAKLAEITSGTGGKLTGITDADVLENALVESDAEENIQIAIQNIDNELAGKDMSTLIDLYIEKHNTIDNNYSQIEGFKQNAPAYMHELGKKIFEKIKNEQTTPTFTLDNKREKMFELAQIARDESARVNIDNDFIDYDLSEEIFVELFSGNGGILDKLDADKNIKPEHKESSVLSIPARKDLFKSFPGGEQIAGQPWVDKPYKDLKIEERTLLATYKNYEDRFGTIEEAKLTDPEYATLIGQQLVEATQVTSEFMMNDYSMRLENNLMVGEEVVTKKLFPGLSDFDNKIAAAYVDMKGLGAFNVTDRTTQKMKEYAPMVATLIVAIIATVVTWGAGSASLVAAIGNAAATIGVTISQGAAIILAQALIGGLVGSAVMVGSEFAQGKAYETFNDGFIDVSTMTATFVGTSLLTMGVGNFLNKVPGIKYLFNCSNKWIRKIAHFTQTAGDGAAMGAIENQRQLWLTGESHPEMILQMMGLSMGLSMIMKGFAPRNKSGTPNSIAEKMIKQGEGNKLLANNEIALNRIKEELKNPKLDTEARKVLEDLKTQYESNQKNIQDAMNANTGEGKTATKANEAKTNGESKTSETKQRTTSVNNTDVKYEQALGNVKEGETIVLEIDGKTMRLKKKGDIYDIQFNETKIKNPKSSTFTKEEVRDMLKKSKNTVRTEIETGVANTKYESAMALVKEGETIVLEIDGKTMRLQKRGDNYDIQFNDTKIKNPQSSKFTEVEVRELLKTSENSVKNNITQTDIAAKYDRVLSDKLDGSTIEIYDEAGKILRLKKSSGDTYTTEFNSSTFESKSRTKAEVIELTKTNSSNLSIEGIRIEEIEMITSVDNVLATTPEGIVVKTKIKGLTDRIKEFFKSKPKTSEIGGMDQEIAIKADEINSATAIPADVKAQSNNIFTKIRDVYKNRKDVYLKAQEAKKTKTKTELGLNAHKQGKPELDGSVSPSGDKRFISDAELGIAMKNGNFEELNFQKGTTMLALRKVGVEYYVNNNIASVKDMVDFVQKNTKLFGGEARQTKLLEILNQEGKSDVQKLQKFNKKVQRYEEISGPKSNTGFDMKAMIDSKVKELISTNALTMKNRGQQEYITKLTEIKTEQNKSVIDDLIQQLNAQSKGVDEVIKKNKSTIDLLFGKAA